MLSGLAMAPLVHDLTAWSATSKDRKTSMVAKCREDHGTIVEKVR